MESDKKVEMIQKAIRNLIEDEEINADTSPSGESLVAVTEDEGDDEKAGGSHTHRRRRLLSKLLSELESFEQDTKGSGESEVEKTPKEVGDSSDEVIIKELKNVKRQNRITHYLVTALIVITLAWQLSEVSLILKIKDGLSNPLQSVGGIFKEFFRNRAPQVDAMKQAPGVIEPTYLSGVKIPELPHLDLPGFDSGDDEDD